MIFTTKSVALSGYEICLDLLSLKLSGILESLYWKKEIKFKIFFDICKMAHRKNKNTFFVVVWVVAQNPSGLSQFHNLNVILIRRFLLTMTSNFIYESISNTTNNLVHNMA